MANLNHTIVAGETSLNAILVAIKVPPQMTTARIASRMGMSLDFDVGDFLSIVDLDEAYPILYLAHPVEQVYALDFWRVKTQYRGYVVSLNS